MEHHAARWILAFVLRSPHLVGSSGNRASNLVSPVDILEPPMRHSGLRMGRAAKSIFAVSFREVDATPTAALARNYILPLPLFPGWALGP